MSSGGGYGPSPDSSTSCERLAFETILQSPVPKVVQRLRTNDVLEIETQGAQGPVVARHPTHGVAGSIISKIAELLRCLADGYTYKGTVINTDGGDVRIRVTPS